MLGTFAPSGSRTLVLVNGAYGHRMVSILKRIGRPVAALEFDETSRVDPQQLDSELAGNADITHVAVVHCETTTGIENDLEAIAEVVASSGRRLLVDAMSSFGALPLDAKRLRCDAIAASSNKCLQGAPGVGFVICETACLAEAKGHCHSVSLDLHDQRAGLESNGQWRFTPPTHVLASLDAALKELDAEGGARARLARYQANADILIDGLTALGFELLLERGWQAPIIVTFCAPTHESWDFERFYAALQSRGFTIYPGKLSQQDSFRVGCIGALDAEVMKRFVSACEAVIAELGIELRKNS